MASNNILEEMKRTTQAQLNGYNNFFIDEILSTRSDNCLYEFLPKTLGFPPMDNAAYVEYWNGTMVPTFQNFKFTTDNFVYDAEARKAAVHGITTADTPVGPFVNECNIFLDFNETGEKITRMREMVDSAAVAGAMTKLNELKAAGAEHGK